MEVNTTLELQINEDIITAVPVSTSPNAIKQVNKPTTAFETYRMLDIYPKATLSKSNSPQDKLCSPRHSPRLPTCEQVLHSRNTSPTVASRVLTTKNSRLSSPALSPRQPVLENEIMVSSVTSATAAITVVIADVEHGDIPINEGLIARRHSSRSYSLDSSIPPQPSTFTVDGQLTNNLERSSAITVVDERLRNLERLSRSPVKATRTTLAGILIQPLVLQSPRSINSNTSHQTDSPR